MKIFNTFRAQSGSIWLIRPGMMPPFCVPDYVLPKPKNPPGNTFVVNPLLRY